MALPFTNAPVGSGSMVGQPLPVKPTSPSGTVATLCAPKVPEPAAEAAVFRSFARMASADRGGQPTAGWAQGPGDARPPLSLSVPHVFSSLAPAMVDPLAFAVPPVTIRAMDADGIVAKSGDRSNSGPPKTAPQQGPGIRWQSIAKIDPKVVTCPCPCRARRRPLADVARGGPTMTGG